MRISKQFKSVMLWLWNHLAEFVSIVCDVVCSVPYYLGYNNVAHDDSEVQEDKKEKATNGRFADGSDGFPTQRQRNKLRRRNIRRPDPAVIPDCPIEDPRIIKYDPGNKDSIYNLKNPYCLVIININFDGIFAPRNGGQADLKNIDYLLKEVARFQKVDIRMDCTRTQILELMDTISSSEKISDHDGFVCFISSHGTRKGIKTCDAGSYVTVDELTARLNGKKCISLRGKPKLFFIQACRGMNKDRGVPHRGVDVDTADDEITPKLPSSADFLICYSTMKGFLSYRRYSLLTIVEDPGSWFIKVVTEVFTEYMQKEDIMQMMTRVNFRVAAMATNEDDHVDGLKQMPVQMYRLRKRLFFGNIPSQ